LLLQELAELGSRNTAAASAAEHWYTPHNPHVLKHLCLWWRFLQLQIDEPPGQRGPSFSSFSRHLLSEQHNATWGLDILDQGNLPLDHIYRYTSTGKQAAHTV
jgi:hypothetical protein